jgi:hypothetical protein
MSPFPRLSSVSVRCRHGPLCSMRSICCPPPIVRPLSLTPAGCRRARGQTGGQG